MANGRGVRPKECKQCGAHGTPAEPISFRGLCRPCGEANITSAITSIATKHGDAHERWREGMRRAVDGD